jgi:hypothetical protein
MHAHRDGIRCGTDGRNVVRLQQREAFFGSESFAGNCLFKQ